jgi:predicted RNA-binding protein with PIN domain
MEQRLIIVDAYNLIHRTPALRPGPDRTLREARERLENLLAWAVGAGDARFLVVYDGAEGMGGEGHSGRVEVRYARPPQKADDLIRTLVEKHVDRAARVTVVTADLEVARHARAMGADVSLSDLFVASIIPADREAPEKPSSLSKKEVEEWAEIFRQGRTVEPSEERPDDGGEADDADEEE